MRREPSLSLRQYDTSRECRLLTFRSGQIRLDPRRRGGPDASEPATAARRVELTLGADPCRGPWRSNDP